MSTISSASISRARRLSPATRSRPRRHVSWPSRDGSERSQASTTKGDVSPRPHSRRRPSSGSTSSALMRSRRSAWRRTTSTSGRASPTWSVPSRSRSRPTPRSPRRSSTTSPSTRRLRATFDARTSSTPRRRDSASGMATPRAVRFVRGNRIWLDFMLGRWDRALESANDVHRRVRGGITAHAGAVRREVARGTLARPWGSGRLPFATSSQHVRSRGERGTTRSTPRLRSRSRPRCTRARPDRTKRARSRCRCLRWFARSGCMAR